MNENHPCLRCGKEMWPNDLNGSFTCMDEHNCGFKITDIRSPKTLYWEDNISGSGWQTVPEGCLLVMKDEPL